MNHFKWPVLSAHAALCRGLSRGSSWQRASFFIGLLMQPRCLLEDGRFYFESGLLVVILIVIFCGYCRLIDGEISEIVHCTSRALLKYVSYQNHC